MMMMTVAFAARHFTFRFDPQRPVLLGGLVACQFQKYLRM
jgi:hypothetical protein